MIFRSELPVSALLLEQRFGSVYQVQTHGIVPLHDLRDFDSLINELCLENLYHFVDVLNLQDFDRLLHF